MTVLRRPCLLVVDDEADFTELLEHNLTRAGYAVRALNDPLGVMALARECRPDLMILDRMMPGLDGVRLLRMIRADATLRETPVILLTARAASEDKQSGFDAGADDYVAKPFDARELLSRVAALLRRARPPAPPGAAVVDVAAGRVVVDGRALPVTGAEMNLLRLLLSPAVRPAGALAVGCA